MSESQNVTISTLTATVAEQTGTTQVLVGAVIKAFLQSVVDNVVSGETVRLSGFATLEAVDVAARSGRNPSTNEAMEIAATKRVSVKISAPFKAAVKATV